MFVELFLSNFVIIKHSNNVLKELICDRKLILQELGPLTEFIYGMVLLLLELVKGARVSGWEMVATLLIQHWRLFSHGQCRL